MNDFLDGEIIKLRAVEPADADLLYDWENDGEMWSVSTTLKPFSKNLLLKYVNSEHLDIFQTKQIRLMIDLKESKQTAGMVDIFDYDPYNSRAGVGIMVHRDLRGKGVAFDALKTLDKYAFRYLNFHQLYCNIALSNEASLNLFKKAGYEVTAIRKDWIFNGEDFEDVYFLQKINPNHK